MSYETNPILNRIKLSKGWKSSTFPTNSLNYHRDIVLWFKVYLFLKVYLLLHGLRLLTCEIRISDVHTKILFLSVVKQYLPPKKSKSKWKTKSFLQKLKNPLLIMSNKKARFLLYLDLQKLKKISFLFFTHSKKKILSKMWIAKPRLFSWLNSTQLIFKWRQQAKSKLIFAWKKKLQSMPLTVRLSMKKKKNNFALKDFNFETTKRQPLFWKKKQRNLFSLLTKVQKDIFVFEKYYLFFWSRISASKDVSFYPLTNLFAHQIQAKKSFLKKIQRLYTIIQERKNSFPKKKIRHKIKSFSWNKKKRQQQIFWSNFMQRSCNFPRDFFFSSLLAKKIILVNKKHFLHENENLIWVTQFRKKIQFSKKKFLTKLSARNPALNITIRKKKKDVIPLGFLLKAQFFKKPRQITPVRIFLWKRISQQKKIRSFNIKSIKSKKSKKFTKSYHSKQIYYKASLKKNYQNFLKVSTNVKLKYLLQDLLHKYFSVVILIKISWPLSEFKNLKFYRLFFPKYKQRSQKEKTGSLKFSKNNLSGSEKYFYIGKNTNHLRPMIKNKFVLTKLTAFSRIWGPKNYRKHSHSLNSSLCVSNLWRKKSKKKDPYFISKQKIMQSKSEKRIGWTSRIPFVSGLITTLTLFVKYLEPQPVVDHLAQIIGTTRKHVATLKLMENILRTFHLKRGLGYRIALIGRINGANKSRTIYLRKLNRNRARQTFSKNVNFALAHARAKIGTFAIKLWVYS